ncbi:hypothetical protein [Thermostilla marina]
MKATLTKAVEDVGRDDQGSRILPEGKFHRSQKQPDAAVESVVFSAVVGSLDTNKASATLGESAF